MGRLPKQMLASVSEINGRQQVTANLYDMEPEIPTSVYKRKLILEYFYDLQLCLDFTFMYLKNISNNPDLYCQPQQPAARSSWQSHTSRWLHECTRDPHATPVQSNC